MALSSISVPLFQSIRLLNLLVLLVVAATSHSFAQQAVWGKFFDSQYGGVTMESCATPTGEVLLFGYYSSELPVGNQVLVPKYNDSGSYIIKLDNAGSVISAFPIDGRGVNVENAKIDSKGDIVIAGRFFESLEFDGQEYLDQSVGPIPGSSFIAKYSQDGTSHWLKIFPNSEYTTLTIDEHDDIYVLSNETMNFISVSSHLRKFNTNGDVIFENEFIHESEPVSYISCIDVRNGEILVGGMVYTSGTVFNSLTYSGSGYGFYLALFNSDGSIKSTKNIGETTYNNAAISDILFDDDGSFYIAGGLANNIMLAKYNALGSLLWSKKSLPQSFSAGYIAKGIDGNIFVATNFYDKAELDGQIFNAPPDSPILKNAPNVALIKFDTAGNILGYQQFEPYMLNLVTSISVSQFNDVFISGFSDAPAIKVGSVNITSPNDTQENNGDGYVVKFDGTSLGAPAFQILANEVCAKESVPFNTNFNANEIKNILWDFGDPTSGNQNSSSKKNPTHNYLTPGLYKVRTAITDISDKKWYSSFLLEIHGEPAFSLGDDYALCEGQVSRVEAEFKNEWSYMWQDGSTNSYFDVSKSGKYWLTITSHNCMAADTVIISTAVAPQFSIADKTLCSGEVYSVDLSAVSGSILWSDGYTLSLRDIDLAGNYSVTASNVCGNAEDSFTVEKIAPLSISVADGNICYGSGYSVDLTEVPATLAWSNGGSEPIKSFFDPGTFTVHATNACETKDATFKVNIIESFDFDLGKDRYICNQSQPITLQISVPNVEYKWSNGSISNGIMVTEPGTYWLEVRSDCYVVRDTIEIRSTSEMKEIVPNVITPNGDPLNEYFKLDEQITGSALFIFNRWGKEVYTTHNYQNDWNGGNLESAVYYYTLPEFCIKGLIHVIR
jgi:gliding motility-associated-like protein